MFDTSSRCSGKTNTLRTLDLVHTKIAGEGVGLICKQLTQPKTSIKRLYLGGNEIGPAQTEFVAEMLEANQSIHSLYLSVNRLADRGIKILAKALQRNRSLIVLSVSSNNIGPEGAWSLVSQLQNHPTILDLDLGYDHFHRRPGRKTQSNR